MTIINQPFRLAMGMAIAGALGGTALAQQSITDFLGTSYSQNFNTLSTDGADQTSLPANWIISEDGGSTTGNYTFNSGSNVADVHSYATSAASSDRSLGIQYDDSHPGNASSRMFGIRFVNNTGTAISAVYIQYLAERWFRPGNDSDRLDFQYSVTSGTDVFGRSSWQDYNPLDHSVTGANTAYSASTVSGTITFTTPIADGGSFAIRWRDSNGGGSTGWGLAVDDLIVMVPEPWQPALVSGLSLLGLLAWKRRQGGFAR